MGARAAERRGRPGRRDGAGNLSGSPITIGRAESRALLARAASLRCVAAYVYAAAGEGESTTDLAWDGQTMVHELGVDARRRASGSRTATTGPSSTSTWARSGPSGCGWARSTTTAATTARRPARSARCRSRSTRPPTDVGLRRVVERFPFVPSDPARLAQDCYEAYNIQVAGLEQRLRAIGGAKVVIGVSGGLDSTHALIVAARAMDRAGRPRSDILAFTMPGLRHVGRAPRPTRPRLATALGVTFEELDIRPAARQMLADLGHPFAVRRAGVRRDVRERPGRAAHRLPVPRGQPARRDRAGHG